MISTFPNQSYYRESHKLLTVNAEIISNKEFEECIFEKINLTGCTFSRCKFINCKFIECMFSAIKPTDSMFNDAEFTDSKIIGFDWTMVKSVYGLSFHNSQINYSNFRFLKLQKLKLINCIAKEVDFTEADLSEGDFTGTDFEGSRFFKTNLSKANFKLAKNYFIDIKTNILKKAVFSYPEAMNLLQTLDIIVEY
jgi:fluoroquinolone resistance protein